MNVIWVRWYIWKSWKQNERDSEEYNDMETVFGDLGNWTKICCEESIGRETEMERK